MPTLDLLSQVLFVALMAMFLYVLYRRFVAMLMKGRITGDYARIVWCKHAEGDRVAVRVDVPAEATCHVRWEGDSSSSPCHGESRRWSSRFLGRSPTGFNSISETSRWSAGLRPDHMRSGRAMPSRCMPSFRLRVNRSVSTSRRLRSASVSAVRIGWSW